MPGRSSALVRMHYTNEAESRLAWESLKVFRDFANAVGGDCGFEAPGFVVCTFAPRMLDTHPDAIKVPYAHSNVQADEVLYYVRGRFGSRRGVEEASFTLHPRGIPHGPHPGTIVASKEVKFTDELAVMVDTFKPLLLTRQALELDDAGYPFSWSDG